MGFNELTGELMAVKQVKLNKRKSDVIIKIIISHLNFLNKNPLLFFHFIKNDKMAIIVYLMFLNFYNYLIINIMYNRFFNYSI